MTVNASITPRNVPAKKQPGIGTLLNPQVQAGLPVVQAAMSGDPQAQQILATVAPQESLVLASAANENTPQVPPPNLEALLNPQLGTNTMNQIAAGGGISPVADNSVRARVARGEITPENFDPSLASSTTGGNVTGDPVSALFGNLLDNTATAVETDEPSGTPEVDDAANQIEQVASDAGLPEEEIKDILQEVRASTMGSGGLSETNPENLIKLIQATGDREVAKEPDIERKALKFEFWSDPRLWSAITGLLLAAASGESLENSLLFAAVGADAGQTALLELEEQNVQDQLTQAGENRADTALGIEQQRANAATTSANAQLAKAVKEIRESDGKDKVVMERILTNTSTEMDREFNNTKDFIGRPTRTPPTFNQKKARANQKLEALGFDARFEVEAEDTPESFVAEPISNEQFTANLGRWQTAFNQADEAGKVQLKEALAGQLSPEQVSQITGE